MTNDESCETNETVFDDGVVSETKLEDSGRVSSMELRDQKIVSEIKHDPSIDENPLTNKGNVENSMKINFEQMEDKNTVKIEPQDQSIEDISTPNDRNNSRRKRRRPNPSTNNNVIQTRSTRSSAHSEQQNESIMSLKKEEETVKQSTKKRTSSTNEEFSNQLMNYSEESNDSKSVISESAGPSSRVADNSDNDVKWKKASSAIIRAVQNHRCAPLVLKPFENNDEYRDAIYQDIDLNATKKRIESGQIRNESEFKRDLMLMFINGIILNTEPNVVKSLVEFAKETIDLFDTTTETTKIKTRDKYHNTHEVMN
ncbi:hypothetical protein BLA29_004711 [Euroglyphus maynei]|uniref:Bromo domain-containing protein n=1 Tax=Euroglyphus maynei TaxID=6958 RepID=A0A1Y3AX11_EURMA|nr:hypothetical protein BLA29_004711 [Euroglyphus maynei]